MNLKQEKNNFNSQLIKTVSARKILDKMSPFWGDFKSLCCNSLRKRENIMLQFAIKLTKFLFRPYLPKKPHDKIFPSNHLS